MEMNGTTVIGRPVDIVFAYVSNVENDIYWREGITRSGWLSGDPLEVESIGYAIAGDTEVEWRLTSYEPGVSMDWELLGGPFQGTGGYRFEAAQGGTQFTLVGDIEPTGIYKLMGPLFAWMGRRRNQSDVEKLRDILESPMGENGQA